MTVRAENGISPRRELNQKLLGRQARSETDGSVFETKPASQGADMVWNQVTASQFTPRHEDICVAPPGGEEASTAAASGGGTGGQRSASPPRKGSSSSASGPRPPNDRAAEELSYTVNELRENMERERERSRLLEKRAAEAEFIAVWLKEELDKSAGNVELDGTCPVLRGIPGQDEDEMMDNTRPVLRRPGGGATAGAGADLGPIPTRPQLGLGSAPITQPKLGLGLPGEASAIVARSHVPGQQVTRMPSYDDDIDVSTLGSDPRQLKEELVKSLQYIEQKQHEIINLEEQNLVLREELNHEKQKVIELKRAANSQKEESQKASGDLEMNHWLQEEVALLRNESSKLREQLDQAAQREDFLKSELADLRAAAGKAKDIHSEEMGRLSVTVGEQLVQVERELAQRTRELSEATEPFLKHAHGLLVAARKACLQIDGASGRPRQAPPLYDLRSRDLANSFRSILKLLKFMVDVLAQHTGMVNPFERSGDNFSACDTSGSLASSTQDNYSQLGSQQQGLRAPSEMESHRRSAHVDYDTELDPAVLKAESISKRWMCYLQE